MIYSHDYHSNQGFNKGSSAELQSTFSYESLSNKKKERRSYNTFDIDEQFRELARESEEFR